MLPRTIRLDSKWGKRVIRVWIALFQPAAVVFGYLAIDHHATTYGMQDKLFELRAMQLERENELFGIPPKNPSRQTSLDRASASLFSKDPELKSIRSGINRTRFEQDQEEEYRDGYIAKSILAAVTPAILLVFYSFITWFWFGDQKK